MKPIWPTRLVRPMLTVLLLMLSSPISAKTIYVDANAPGPNTGTSWTNAYRFLQDALADANSSPKPIEIRVAQGIYRPDRTSANSNGTGNKKAFFQLISAVTLKGGYGGSGHVDPNGRDVELYKSLLSGDLLENDTLYPQPMDNSHCVVDGSYTDRTAILDGFVVTGGYPILYDRMPPQTYEKLEWSAKTGGGMRNISGSPTIIKCTFQQNCCAAYNVLDSNPDFIDCRFVQNCVQWMDQTCTMTNLESHPRITGSVFEDTSDCTTVIYTRDGDVLISECRFSGNEGRAIVTEGGKLELITCDFNGNTGGAVSITNGAIAHIYDCVFRENAADRGGGIYAEPMHLTLSRCVFQSNSARHSGGGVYFASNNGYISLSDCVFQSNSAGWMGGGLYLCCNEVGASIKNCIFESNTASQGGGLYNQANNLMLVGCAFVGNRAIKVDAGFYIPWYGMGGAVYDDQHEILQLISYTFAGSAADQGPSVMSETPSLTGCVAIGARDLRPVTDKGRNLNRQPCKQESNRQLFFDSHSPGAATATLMRLLLLIRDYPAVA